MNRNPAIDDMDRLSSNAGEWRLSLCVRPVFSVPDGVKEKNGYVIKPALYFDEEIVF